MKKHCILLFTLLASSFTFLAPAQNRLVSVTYEKVLTIHDQFEAMFKDFGDGFDQKDTASAWKFAKKIQRIGQEVCFVCLNYRTEDPDGKALRGRRGGTHPPRRFRLHSLREPRDRQPCAGP